MTSPKGPKAADSTPNTAGFTPGDVPSHMQQFAAQWAQSVHEQIDRLAQATEQMGTYGVGLMVQWQSAAFEAARKAVDMVAPRP